MTALVPPDIRPDGILLVGDFSALRQNNCSVAEELRPRLKEAGWQVHVTAERQTGPRKLVEMLSTILALRDRYAVASVDVYSGRAFLWALVTTGALRSLGKPVVLVLHGGGLPAMAKRRGALLRLLLGQADVVVAPSGYLASQLAPFRDGIRIIPNAVDLASYRYRLRRQPQARLLWLRAFASIYRPTMAPEVLAHVRGELPDATMTMVGPDKGDGSLEATRARARELGVSEHLDIVPGIPKSSVPRCLDEHDVFVNTTNVDNTPVTLVEAMASGLSIVSTNVGGIPHLVEHGQTALLCQPGDARTMADDVLRLLREPGLAGDLSRAARKRAEELDWAPVARSWNELYRSVVEVRETRETTA